MKLYGFPFSPNTWKVRAVAAQLGLSVEDVFVDLGKGEQRAPEYLKLNPTGRTPTLVHGDFVLWESTAIMQYLASQKPNPLWPNNARTRAEITQWQSWHLQHWGASACNPLTFERFVKGFFNMGPPDATVLARLPMPSTRRPPCSTGISRRVPIWLGATQRSPTSRLWRP
jgi:glutathione S-transferase